MRQRLGLAAALLGDPELLVLDEPANGLDPEGVRWLRDFLRAFASGGRTVLISSHVLAEVAQTVDQVLIISRGRLVVESSLERADRARRRRGARAQPRADASWRRRSSARRTRRERRTTTRCSSTAPPASASARSPSPPGSRCTSSSPKAPSLEEIFLELTAEEQP